MIPTLLLERELLREYPLVIACDEVGRGALAGPVSVGATVVDAVMLDACADAIPEGLKDSKLVTERKRPELAYARIFNNVNGEIATVYRDGLTFQDLPEPQKLAWDRAVYPPRLLDQMAYEMVQPVTGTRHTFYERRLLLYRESFGRIFPIGVLTVAFNKMPPSIEEADRMAESCIGRQIVSGAKIAEGWPSGRVLSDSA